jgi:hypothetical protein
MDNHSRADRRALVCEGIDVTVYTLPGTPFTKVGESQLALGA